MITVLDSSGNPQSVNTLPSLGNKTKSGSLPVTMASDQDPTKALPDGNLVNQISCLMQNWVDDFGGTVLDTTSTGWDVYDGGNYGANNTGNSAINNVAFSNVNGSLVTGITYSIGSSVLSVVMPTTINSELWFVSKHIFTSPVDFYLTMKMSQRITGNQMWAELVECDPNTGQLVPNATVVGEVRNRGSILIPSSATAGAVSVESTCDDSSLSNSVASTTMTAVTGDVDFLMELRPQDVIVSNVAADTLGAKSSGAVRISRQVPDPNKAYKLRLRFKNIATPASSTTITLYRVMVADVQELVTEITSGRGDTVAGKSLPVNIVAGTAAIGTTTLTATTATIGNVSDIPTASPAAPTTTALKVVSSASTYSALLLTGTLKRLVNGSLFNTGASPAYVKFYNKATAPTVGTDVPIATFCIPAGGFFNVKDHVGNGGLYAGTLGIGIGISGAVGDTDTTVLAANQIVGTLWSV